MYLANVISAVSHLNIHPAFFKYFVNSDIIVVKKEKSIKNLLTFGVLMLILVLNKDKIVGERLDVQID